MEAAVKIHHTTLEREIESVKQYLQNEAFRYEGKLFWECALDPEVDTAAVIPRSLILTFVENAIKHGIFQNPDGGKLDISVNKSRIGVLIIISDNGAERKDIPLIHQYQAAKLKLLDQYLYLFNQKHACEISYQILERSTYETDRTGTRVLITLKD